MPSAVRRRGEMKPQITQIAQMVVCMGAETPGSRRNELVQRASDRRLVRRLADYFQTLSTTL